ncbi:hypothetical protein EDB84DRAFT_1576119, partial [Lactarius hengduanensis]
MVRGARRLPVRAEGGRTRAYRSRRPPPSFPLSAPPHGAFTRKGGARGYAAPGPSLPMEGVHTRHATPPLRVAPAPSSLRPGHATPPLFTRRARAR